MCVFLTFVSPSPLLGVKEAFLKIAQGVSTLHQRNQLSGASNITDYDYSPVNSFTRTPTPGDIPRTDYFYQTTHSPEESGERVGVEQTDRGKNGKSFSCC